MQEANQTPNNSHEEHFASESGRDKRICWHRTQLESRERIKGRKRLDREFAKAWSAKICVRFCFTFKSIKVGWLAYVDFRFRPQHQLD
ncbi:hypothetical protein FRX31_009732 [Thalictrum thalictroides]|uniref:Uncharacterized protein n=1 Tax=Thalictrum thalictroides TaxID=46969 RepID=A0A7J6WTF2_THATH|nr:hypothetical protein FRX31_009732 [Thalictrum thalictroides]